MDTKETTSTIDGLIETAKAFLTEQGLEFGLSLLTALFIFLIGRSLSKVINKVIIRFMSKSKVDETLISFVTNITYSLLMCFVIIAALGQLGVQTSSMIAIIGAAGLAVGLALKDSLSNFAAGVMIIAFRPFKKGDYIEAGGAAGTVHDLKILTTTLKSPDNKILIIPNSSVFGGTITNYSAEKTRRVDMVFGIGYDDDIKKAKEILLNIADNDARILKDPAPVVAVKELGDSSINIILRPWVASADYWGVYFDTHEAVKYAFDEAGISIPYPQRDVHLHQVNA